MVQPIRGLVWARVKVRWVRVRARFWAGARFIGVRSLGYGAVLPS